jgi:transcriptional regulator with XRE-family HTH domain
MKTFEFSVIASGLDPEAEGFADRFFNAGCDDATISFQKGHIILDFLRDADSVDEAICSAVECVKRAGAHVDRVEPDTLVSLSEIAARTGLSRAAITQYAKGKRGSADFPAPVARVTSDTSLYDWSQVATWLYRHEKLSRDEAIEAAAVKAVNEAICTHEPKLRDALQERLRNYEAELEVA